MAQTENKKETETTQVPTLSNNHAPFNDNSIWMFFLFTSLPVLFGGISSRRPLADLVDLIDTCSHIKTRNDFNID